MEFAEFANIRIDSSHIAEPEAAWSFIPGWLAGGCEDFLCHLLHCCKLWTAKIPAFGAVAGPGGIGFEQASDGVRGIGHKHKLMRPVVGCEQLRFSTELRGLE